MCGANIILNFGWSIMCLGYLQSMVIIHKNNLWFNPHISWQVEKEFGHVSFLFLYLQSMVIRTTLHYMAGRKNNFEHLSYGQCFFVFQNYPSSTHNRDLKSKRLSHVSSAMTTWPVLVLQSNFALHERQQKHIVGTSLKQVGACQFEDYILFQLQYLSTTSNSPNFLRSTCSPTTFC